MDDETMTDFGGVLTVILSAVAVVAMILKGFQLIMVYTLVRFGFIRPLRRISDNPEDAWPNGWHSLPETLEGIHEMVKAHVDSHDRPNG